MRRFLRPILGLLALAALPLALSACQTLATGAAVASAGKTAYDVATEVETGLKFSEATVCGGWGAYYALAQKGEFSTPDALAPEQEALATICSADPKPGTLRASTLLELAAGLSRLVSAQAAPPPPRAPPPRAPASWLSA